MVFHGFWLISMVFQGGFMVFHGFWLVSMVFQGGFMVFHGFWLVLGWFSWFFMVPDWFFMVFNGSRLVFHFHIENTLKLYSGLTIQSRLCRPWAGFGLVT